MSVVSRYGFENRCDWDINRALHLLATNLLALHPDDEEGAIRHSAILWQRLQNIIIERRNEPPIGLRLVSDRPPDE
jgi:hypothetical protein